MFTQFRNAVESIAVQPRSSIDATTDVQSSTASTSQSGDISLSSQTSQLSSNQLAESALSNLRKSLTTSRAPPRLEKSASLPSSSSEKPRQKMNLEERLRASLSSVDVSTASSTSPSPMSPVSALSEDKHDPASTPLPDSPISSPPPLNIHDPPTQGDIQGRHNTSSLTEDEEKPSQTKAGSTKTLGDDVHVIESENGQVESASTGNKSGSNVVEEDEKKCSRDDEHPFELNIPSTDARNGQDERLKALEAPSAQPMDDADIDTLRRRLKQVEQYLSDVSTSFKRLSAEKLAADTVLRNLTPLEGIEDSIALKEYLESLHSKTDVFQDEMKRLNGKLEVQEDRIEDLRETHKLSSSVQVKQLDALQGQLRETDALYKDAQRNITTLEETLARKDKEVSSLKSDLERSNIIVREEEEKRTKAISLLKSIRQKLVKAEKDKEDALKEVATLREKDKVNADKEQTERNRFEREIEVVRAEKETILENMRTQYEKEMVNLKERYDKGMAAMRSQFELDAITSKSSYNKEIASKNSHINTLESSLNNVTRDKNSFFEQLQLRQAEAESAQSHLESIQHQNTELQYQLREANDKVSLLKEDINELQREQDLRAREPSTSTENIAHLLASVESKHEAKITELRRINTTLEKERNDSEAEWSRKLKARGAEIEELKRLLGNSTKSHEKEEEAVAELEVEVSHKQEEIQNLEHQLADLAKAYSRLETSNSSFQSAATDLHTKITVLEKQLEEAKAKDAQMRQTNKSLREELRKVQSSAAILERQRNPGVGYWTTRTTENSSPDATAETPRASPPAVNPPSEKNEEQVNLEYLRNVILQFLEYKEMRPNLVRVLSIILQFTPQETRRLMSKV